MPNFNPSIFQIPSGSLLNFFGISLPWNLNGTFLEAFKIFEVPPAEKVLEIHQASIFPPLEDSGMSSRATDTESISFSILDLNFWLLPWPVPIDQEERIDTFLEIVQKENPDIVTLQEVWLFSYAERIRKLLKGYWCITPQPGLYNQTGLVIFSRVKPEAADFGYFGLSTSHNLVELFANKGFLRARLCIGKETVDIVSSHLYAGRSQHDGNDITDRQILALKVLTASSAIPIFIGTDLNTSVTDFQKINSDHFVLESDLTSSTKAKTNDSKIDYILGINPGKLRMTIETRVIREPIVSDHLPVFGRVTISPL